MSGKRGASVAVVAPVDDDDVGMDVEDEEELYPVPGKKPSPLKKVASAPAVAAKPVKQKAAPPAKRKADVPSVDEDDCASDTDLAVKQTAALAKHKKMADDVGDGEEDDKTSEYDLAMPAVPAPSKGAEGDTDDEPAPVKEKIVTIGDQTKAMIRRHVPKLGFVTFGHKSEIDGKPIWFRMEDVMQYVQASDELCGETVFGMNNLVGPFFVQVTTAVSAKSKLLRYVKKYAIDLELDATPDTPRVFFDSYVTHLATWLAQYATLEEREKVLVDHMAKVAEDLDEWAAKLEFGRVYVTGTPPEERIAPIDGLLTAGYGQYSAPSAQHRFKKATITSTKRAPAKRKTEVQSVDDDDDDDGGDVAPKRVAAGEVDVLNTISTVHMHLGLAQGAIAALQAHLSKSAK